MAKDRGGRNALTHIIRSKQNNWQGGMMGNYDRGFSGRADRGMDPIWKIVLGIVIVIASVYLGAMLYTKYVIHEASQVVNETTSALQTSLQAGIERSRQQQLAIEQQRTRQKQLELDFKREQMERQADQQEAARIKEAAWKKFYKQPTKCENVSKQDLLVECGNFYIKEKNRFEEMWANNEKRPM